MELLDYIRTFPSQAAAARVLGVSQGAISHWLTGKRRPRPDKAREIVIKSKGKVSLDRIYAIRSAQ